MKKKNLVDKFVSRYATSRTASRYLYKNFEDFRDSNKKLPKNAFYYHLQGNDVFAPITKINNLEEVVEILNYHPASGKDSSLKVLNEDVLEYKNSLFSGKFSLTKKILLSYIRQTSGDTLDLGVITADTERANIVEDEMLFDAEEIDEAWPNGYLDAFSKMEELGIEDGYPDYSNTIDGIREAVEYAIDQEFSYSNGTSLNVVQGPVTVDLASIPRNAIDIKDLELRRIGADYVSFDLDVPIESLEYKLTRGFKSNAEEFDIFVSIVRNNDFEETVQKGLTVTLGGLVKNLKHANLMTKGSRFLVLTSDERRRLGELMLNLGFSEYRYGDLDTSYLG
jgi:hypothetical protein